LEVCEVAMDRIEKLTRILFILIAGLCMACIAAEAAPAKKAGPPPLPGLPLGDVEASIGAPMVVGRLTVFPIYGRSRAEYENMISLEAALDAGKASVRERKEGSAPSRGLRNRRTQQQAAVDAGGATVGTLVIENRGKRPIFVLAGTVVKGGNQDRQIAQDFVIAAHETVPVDAFCVEQGRWSGVREGKATGGNFRSTKLLAPSKVRSAGQYEGDQGKVWSKVAEVNAENQKRAGSGTLMATYDDREIGARRKKLSQRARKALKVAPQERKVVGLAWAIDGDVRAARWFASRALFEQHRDKLVETAAMEAVTVAASSSGAKKAAKTSARDVRDFIREVRKAKVEATKKTRGMNANRYRKSKRGYAAEAVVTTDGKEDPVAFDVVAK
jgi:hypothetical protein